MYTVILRIYQLRYLQNNGMSSITAHCVCFFCQNTRATGTSTTHCVISQIKLLRNEYILQSNALHDDGAHLNISICFATERNECMIFYSLR